MVPLIINLWVLETNQYDRCGFFDRRLENSENINIIIGRLGGSRARELASLQAGRYRAWSRAPGAMGEYRKRPRGKHGAPPASAWSEWKHERGSEEAACTALWRGR